MFILLRFFHSVSHIVCYCHVEGYSRRRGNRLTESDKNVKTRAGDLHAFEVIKYAMFFTLSFQYFNSILQHVTVFGLVTGRQQVTACLNYS